MPARKFCQGVERNALRAVLARSTDAAIAGAVAHAIQRTLRSVVAMSEDAMLICVARTDPSFICTATSYLPVGGSSCTAAESYVQTRSGSANQTAGKQMHEALQQAARTKVADLNLRKAQRKTGVPLSKTQELPSDWTALKAHCRLGHPGTAVMHALGFRGWKESFCERREIR